MCCPPTIFPFGAALQTIINYTAAMIVQYGVDPNVQVYFQDGTEYVLSDDMNMVKFDGVNITVDNGGAATGFVKVF